MRLTLSIPESPRIQGADLTYSLSEGNCVIGRAPGADWHLPDSERILSKTHCRIDAQPDGFTITDLSTNGVLLNGTPVGYEHSRQLADGDRLRLGDMDLSVSIAPDQDAARMDAAAGLFPAQGPFAHDAVGDRTADNQIPGPATEGPRVGPASATLMQAAAGSGRSREDSAVGTADTTVLSPTNAIVIGLVRSFPGIDASKLALAVDAAGAAIPEAEWQAFYRRLRTFLQERYIEK